MSIHITSLGAGLQGITIPLVDHEVLDAEFADDTSLFLKGTLINLQKAEEAINIFCTASGAKINWNKTTVYGWDKMNSMVT